MRRWLERQYEDIKGHYKWAILVLLWAPMSTALNNLLRHIPHIPDWAVWGTVLVASLAVFLWFAKSQQALPSTEIQTSNQGILPDMVESFYQTYNHQMLIETEANVRRLAVRFQSAAERESYYVRFIAAGLLNYVFDIAWFTIYASQIKVLQRLNVAPLTREEVRPFYNSAAAQFPQRYENYGFDKWLGFLRSWQMILEEGDSVQITVRGSEFLKYLVAQHKDVDIKSF